MKVIDEIVHNYKLKNGHFDEPDIQGSFIVSGYEWVGKIWPPSNEYRIVEYEDRSFNRYGLQARIDDTYADVMVYDDGCLEEFGKLFIGRWKNISDTCSWSIGGLKRLRNAIAGIPETPKPVDV